MGPSSGFLLLLISISIILTHAGPVPDTECPPDQVYNKCRSACDPPCGKRDPDLLCTQQCITGCFCKPGFTFLEGSNKTKCAPCKPTSPVPDKKCPPGQEYNACGSACDSPCGKKDPDRLCTQQCVPGCYCKPGFRFLEGKCVRCKPTSPVPDSKCPRDQIYYECGSPCSIMCAKSDPRKPCIQMCMTGCFCKPGFTFLEGSNKTKCVPCKPTSPVPDTKCPPDQEYNECASRCDPPCGKRDPDRLCTAQCITGCFCKAGFTFLEGSNKTKCVPCDPPIPVPKSDCPPDQIYYECGSPCSIMCAKSKPGQPCIDMCMTGCFCKPGFTFLEGSNKTKCVPCKPTSPVPDTKCPPDQEYNECASGCDSLCGERDPDRLCTAQCITGCFCKAGFTFLEGSNKTKCVPCKPTSPVPDTKCPPDQEYNKCGSACDSPCGKRDPDLLCTRQCIAGCFCKAGFTFLEGSNKTKCVPCNPPIPVPDSECPPDQIYYACGSPCSMMCAKRKPGQPCIEMCMTGCFCKPGFTFLEGSNETKCVPCK